MPKRRVILVGAAVTALLLLAFLRPRRAGLMIEGEPTDVWIRQLASETWGGQAKRTLIAAGLPVLPEIARAFEQADSVSYRAQSKLHDFNEATAKTIGAPFPWEKVRTDLAEIMGSIGSNYRFSGVVQTGAPPKELQIAVDCLTRGLQQTNATLRVWCAQELARIGPNAQSAVPALLKAWRVGDLADIIVFQAFGSIGPGGMPQEVVQALGKGLRSRDGNVQRASIEALSGLEKNASPALPALVDLLDRSHQPIADAALAAIARIGPPVSLKKRLEEYIILPDQFRRASAAVALLRIEPGHARAMAVVRESIEQDKFATLRSSTVYLLGGMGAPARIFEAELGKLEHDRDPNVATFARNALIQIPPAK